MDEFSTPNEPLIRLLKWMIHMAVRAPAVLMTAIIIFSVFDVAAGLYHKLFAPPRFLLTGNDIIGTFGAFMAALIAIEIFINIAIYLRRRRPRTGGTGHCTDGCAAQSDFAGYRRDVPSLSVGPGGPDRRPQCGILAGGDEILCRPACRQGV